MTRLTNSNLKGLSIKEVKQLLKKERGFYSNEWGYGYEVNENNENVKVYHLAYSEVPHKVVYCTVDKNGIVTKVEKLNFDTGRLY